jgi:hypothetical protein
MIPNPPDQSQPWTAPATALPKFLVSATASLFEQGVADPRGCEYRQVEAGNGAIAKVHGFVLPERADTPARGRFVIGWDGLVHPAWTVGDPVDLDRDIKDLAETVRKRREGGAAQVNRYRPGALWSFPLDHDAYYGSGIDDSSPIKLCLLLRLGRADLAEALFAAGTTWRPAPRAGAGGRDLTDYGISYMTLAQDWAGSAFNTLIVAHQRSEDVIALDTARKLARFRDLASARADALGFPISNRPNRGDTGTGTGPAPRFYFLTQLDDLLLDHERRAAMPPRGPIPKKGGDPSARIAALIRDLVQIDEQQMMSPGAAHPGSSPLVRDLVAEGDPAVAPLLEVLESDERLTRSVSEGRGMSIERFVHPVHEAALDALTRILRTNEFANQRFSGWSPADAGKRKALAALIRQFWEKTRSVPLIERWYRTLLDDSADPARWLEAASGIVAPEVKEGMPLPRPGTRPLQGESLRDGRDPSVTALLLRRAGQIERTGNPLSTYDQGVSGACHMALHLAMWDEQAALPLLKTLSKECHARSERWRAQEHPGSPDRSLASNLVEFTEIRTRLGDAAALDEYADWLRTTTPKMLEHSTLQALKPLLARPDHPALAAAARWLFNDATSPWVPLLPEARRDASQPFENLFASPLMVVAGFREGVLTGLEDRSPLGTVERDADRTVHRKIKDFPTMNFGSSQLDQEGFAIGVEYPFRNCDLLASKLSELEGSPRCELFWPEARRDEAVTACVAYVKRYGGRFTAEAPPGALDGRSPAHLTFPVLDRPATREDVAAARAIFSLEGQGETRLARLPALPQRARWVTLKDTPIERTYYPGGITLQKYDTDGYVWQAEEVRQGDRWERFYGFVGRHVIARAPASEIEFASPFHAWGNLEGGLDARTELAEPHPDGFDPGRPIVVALQIRNRLGVPRSSPAEFLRPAPDGKPAMRRGLGLSLWHSTARGPKSAFRSVYPDEAIEPVRDAHFDPGDGERPLAPLEGFEAMRFDLNDWFDLTKPGAYRFRLTCTAASGLGEGSASEVCFQVGSDE